MEIAIAIIETGIVINMIVVNDNDIDNSGAGVLVPNNVPVGIGWNYDGKIFTPPPKTTKQLETEMQDAADAFATAQAKADAAIRYLVTHTPTEITDYVRSQVNAAGVTNLATAQISIAAIETLLSKLAVAVAEAVKRQLR